VIDTIEIIMKIRPPIWTWKLKLR